MTDSVAVFPPGWRLLDASGDPVPGGVLRWYDAGTSTPKTVYSDHDLGTSLGTSVTVDAGGYPTSDGSTKVSVYLGSSDYKISAEDADAVALWSLDDQKGAVAIPDAAVPAAERPVETKSLDYTVVVGDQGKVFRSNVTGGSITYTLPSAVTAATGWAVTILHVGTANVAKIATVSSQTITEGATSYAAQAVLSREGESMTLVSDGGNWVVAEHIGNPIVSGGVIPVEDRITAEPGAPVEGAYYIVSSGYDTFSTHDLLLYTGASYVAVTPVEDCGWVAWVKDEDLFCEFRGTAWAIRAATQTEMEAATSATKFVTPAVQHYHPGMAKFWAYVTVSAGTPTLATSYNVTSITDTAAGRLTITIANDFSSADWCCQVTPESNQSGASYQMSGVQSSSKAAGSVQVWANADGGGSQDPIAWHVAGFGDL